MKKKILLISLLFVVGLFTITGCGKSNKSVTLNVGLKGENHIASVKENDTLSYNIMGTVYTFEIVEITDTELKIKVDQTGLTTSYNLSAKDTEFTVKKGEKLELHTQTTDVQDKITFSF